ncbi:MAG: glycosyltransferase family 4 protein [Vicinamibacteria bacterium]
MPPFLQNTRRRIGIAAYAVVFLSFIFAVRMATFVLNVVRFDRWASALRRRRGAPPRILFLASFFPGNAGFEQRVRKWCTILNEAGFDARWRHAIEEPAFSRLLANGRVSEFHLRFAFKRFWQCLEAAVSDGVIVERELLVYNDYGGLFLERFLLALNRRVALDYDDDIGAAKKEPFIPSRFARLMGGTGRKFQDMLKTYPFFIAGTRYLANLVPQADATIVVVPTCLNVLRYGCKQYTGSLDRVTFGWVGGVSNLPYLDIVLPALQAISRDRPCKLLVLSGKAYDSGETIEVENRAWNYLTETADLLDVDIGLMPVAPSRIAEGKCGYKQLQYMASSLVGVASDVGPNREIITDGVDGFLVRHPEDWEKVLRHALTQVASFEAIGRAARKRIEEAYSFEGFRQTYVDFVSRLIDRETPQKAR